MDQFITRHPAEPRTRKPPPPPARQLVQARIEDMRRVVHLDTVKSLVKSLQEATETSQLVAVLTKLGSYFVSLDILEETGIGRVVYRLSRDASSPDREEVAALALELYKRWRQDAVASSAQRSKRSSAGTGSSSTQPQAKRAAASSSAGGGKAGSKAAAPAGEATSTRDASSDFMVAPEVDIEREIEEWDSAIAGARLKPRRTLPSSSVAASSSSSSSSSLAAAPSSSATSVSSFSAAAPMMRALSASSLGVFSSENVPAASSAAFSSSSGGCAPPTAHRAVGPGVGADRAIAAKLGVLHGRQGGSGGAVAPLASTSSVAAATARYPRLQLKPAR